jgi:hypothetical protein
LLVSLDTVQPVPTYAEIAAGNYDASISSFLRSVNQAAIQYHLGAIYVDFEHEVNNPGGHTGLGTPAQFVTAWDHVHALAASAGLNWYQGGRLHWALILSHTAFRPMAGRGKWAMTDGQASAYFPGTNEVDIIAADGYSGAGCGAAGPVTPTTLFAPVVEFAQAHGGLPVFISEWGSAYAASGTQPRFIQQMEAYVAANQEIAAALYWDGPRAGVVHTGCDVRIYSVNPHPTSVAAMAIMAQSPALQGHIVTPN